MPQFIPQQSLLSGGDGWFRTPLGSAWLASEQEVASELLERVFGFDAVSLDIGWPGRDLLSSCPIHRRLSIGPGEDANLRCELDAVPLGSATVDAVLLPHTLEFVASPHQLLREADRVLVGEGHLLVFGFNPRSSWAFRRWLRRREFPATGHPLAESRLRDWLQLLGFEIIASRRFFRRPPLNHPGLLQRLQPLERPRWLPMPASGYALLARKHLHGMTPLRVAVERKPQLAGVAEPTARLLHRSAEESRRRQQTN